MSHSIPSLPQRVRLHPGPTMSDATRQFTVQQTTATVDNLFMWRGHGIVLLGQHEDGRWILARGWKTADALEDVRRWSFADPGPLVGHLKGGRVKAFAHSGSARFPIIPDVPTMAEVGFPGIVMDSFMGFMAQRALPEPIAKRLEAEFIAMAKDPDFSAKVRQQGLVTVGSTSQEFAARIAREVPMWKDVAKTAKIQLQ